MKRSLFKVLSTIVTIFVTIASLTPQYFATDSVFKKDNNGSLSAMIVNKYYDSTEELEGMSLTLTKTFRYSDELNNSTLSYFKNTENFSNIFEIQRNTTPTDKSSWEYFNDFTLTNPQCQSSVEEGSEKTCSIEYSLYLQGNDNSKYSFRVREKDLSKISDIKDNFSSDNMCKEGKEGEWAVFDDKKALITNTHTSPDQEQRFKITYTSGTSDVEGKPPTDDKTYEKNSSATILGNKTLVREGYKFIGWATEADATKEEYREGTKIEITENITLYPVWQLLITSDLSVQIKYSFSADGNITIGASGDYELDGETLTVPEDAETYKLNETVNLKNAPSVSGYSFDGWRLEGKNGSTKKLGASFKISQNILDEYAVLSDDFKEETDEPNTSGADKKSDSNTSGADKKSDSNTSGADKKSDANTFGASDLKVSLLSLKNTAYLSVQSPSSNNAYILALVGSYSKNSTSSSDNSSSGFANAQDSNSQGSNSQGSNSQGSNSNEDVKEITVNFMHQYFSLDKEGNEILDGKYKSSGVIKIDSNINIEDYIKNTFNEVTYQYIESNPEFDNDTLTFDKAKELTNNGKKELTITLIYKIADGEFSWDSELKSGVGEENIAKDVAEENLESGDINLISDDTVNTGKYMFIIPFIAIIAAAVYAIAFMNKKTL